MNSRRPYISKSLQECLCTKCRFDEESLIKTCDCSNCSYKLVFFPKSRSSFNNFNNFSNFNKLDIDIKK